MTPETILSEYRNTASDQGGTNSPLFSVILPCYGVEDYLAPLCESLDAQDFDHGAVEVIFVIDGSMDSSESRAIEWARSTDYPVIVLTQANGGVAAARNTGLDAARGEWIALIDPDDEVGPSYFSETARALREFPHAQMAVTRQVKVNANGSATAHSLNFRFNRNGDAPELVNLEELPEFIHLHASGALVRRQYLREHGITFETALREGFEDAHFFARLLLTMERPEYLIVNGALYYYKERADSIIAQGRSNFAKYLAIIPAAYFDLLDRTDGNRPAWVSNLLMYDIWWLFREYNGMLSTAFALSARDQETLDRLSVEVFQRIGVEHVRRFRVVNLPFDTRAAWEEAAVAGGATGIALERDWDPIRKLQKVAVHSGSDEDRFVAQTPDGELAPKYSKAREIQYFGRTWVYEHVLWFALPARPDAGSEIRVSRLSGPPLYASGRLMTGGVAGKSLGTVRHKPGERLTFKPRARTLGDRLRSAQGRQRARRERLKYSLAYRLGGLTGLRKRYENAWVFMDRGIQANDNAEALYRWAAEHEKERNIFFVLNKTSPDYARLKRAGFRLVPRESLKHFVLMKEAQALFSSNADQYVVQPFPWKYMRKSWLFVFLQHGVTHNSLHRWLNRKDIDLFVASTEKESESIGGSPTPYKFSDREMRLTGMPRHDRLVELTAAGPPQHERRMILLAPTWRNYLLEPQARNGGDRQRREGFFESEFVRRWTGVFESERLKELATHDGAEIVLLPHPGVDEHWTELRLPAHIRRASYLADDVQRLMAEAKVVVTDYSSQAFEGAYCGAPTVYYQFDRAEFYSGAHVGSATGYFDHERDGFGPVASTQEEFESALAAMFRGTHPGLPDYLRRIAAQYPLRDGRASQRVLAAADEMLSEGDSRTA